MRRVGGLEIFRRQTRVLRDAGEHFGADLLVMVECPDEVGESSVSVLKLNVRPTLRKHDPTSTQESSENPLGFRTRPLSHADAQVRLIDLGTIFDFSTRSAMTRKASA